MSDPSASARGPARSARRGAVRACCSPARSCWRSCCSGVIVAVTGGGSGASASAEHSRPAAARGAAEQRAGGRERLRAAGGPSDRSVEQSAAGAVGDGRLDAGAAEPGRVRAAALERAVEDVLRARSRRRAAGRDEPVGGGNRRARQRAVPAARGRRAERTSAASAQLDCGGPVQFAGYRYDSYTPAEAQVAVVFRGPEGKLLAVVTSMVWRDGDWKYLFPAGGTPAMQVIGGSDRLRPVEQLLSARAPPPLRAVRARRGGGCCCC